jgi:hypothetical protein
VGINPKGGSFLKTALDIIVMRMDEEAGKDKAQGEVAQRVL